jgi:hypothetical protein
VVAGSSPAGGTGQSENPTFTPLQLYPELFPTKGFDVANDPETELGLTRAAAATPLARSAAADDEELLALNRSVHRLD